MSKNISLSYETKMISEFEKHFINLYSNEDLINLKLITKSLLFTLIPYIIMKSVNYIII